MGASKEGGGPVHHHLTGHGFPLGAAFIHPALVLRHFQGDGVGDALCAVGQAGGASKAALGGSSGLAHKYIFQRRELAAAVDRGRAEGAAPGRLSLHHIEVLHDHHGREPLTVGKVDSNQAVLRAVAVAVRYQAGAGEHTSGAVRQVHKFGVVPHGQAAGYCGCGGKNRGLSGLLGGYNFIRHCVSSLSFLTHCGGSGEPPVARRLGRRAGAYRFHPSSDAE